MIKNYERSILIERIRGQIVGPSRTIKKPQLVSFENKLLKEPPDGYIGPICWKPEPISEAQEILYFDRESPSREYGAGALYPIGYIESVEERDVSTDNNEARDSNISSEISDDRDSNPNINEDEEEVIENTVDGNQSADSVAQDYDFEISSPDVYKPSTMGISFCVEINDDGNLEFKLPLCKRFFWQNDDAKPFQLNGCYVAAQAIGRETKDKKINLRKVWMRMPISKEDITVTIPCRDLKDGDPILDKQVDANLSAINLCFDIFPRSYGDAPNKWLITVYLKNTTQWSSNSPHDATTAATLFQSHFEVSVKGGKLLPYPESKRNSKDMDDDESSLSLLYSNSQTWAIGHGCSAAWDADPGDTPSCIYGDSLPAVELPSMTPDIEIGGQKLSISMRDMLNLDTGVTRKASGWALLDKLVNGYQEWISGLESSLSGLTPHKRETAERHISACKECCTRMINGYDRIKNDSKALDAFKLTNHAMLLQQISAKGLEKREIKYILEEDRVLPDGPHKSPAALFKENYEQTEGRAFGKWRAFQIAFLLMSLDGMSEPNSKDREIVDLIWFPTGGGKTEAYLAVMAFLMFNNRIAGLHDGVESTTVLMRYTLRMLTTQQFQRASSLICSMEHLRRKQPERIPGPRFSVGLWLGKDGTPNTAADALAALQKYKSGKSKGNPMVLTECPWCRCSIGLVSNYLEKPDRMYKTVWYDKAFAGIQLAQDVPRLVCPDSRCEFGTPRSDDWLPVEVIDKQIYDKPPSLVIATADKLALLSYKPEAGAIFGVKKINNQMARFASPPSLIIQDELHLISGPLGTMYGLYESIFEDLCTDYRYNLPRKPKVIASTATIRGAADQVKSIYNRNKIQLFPSPGVDMSDSFFGKYARTDDGKKLRQGRLYLGIHANGFSSVMTAQVRTFATTFFTPWDFNDTNKSRDPWWTLLTFYNSIRELGSGKTLFASDIRSRLKYLFKRDGFLPNERRRIGISHELTSRLSQAEIIQMMDLLNVKYANAMETKCISSCLASNIIEVGVDIDRLSLLAIVGQPKSTSSYIQISGRVGRKWEERPGLILTLYSPSKSRDRSHFEQFHSYHRRLYEKVEPTSATPFSISALQRGMAGAVLAWVRQKCAHNIDSSEYLEHVETACELIRARCESVLSNSKDLSRTLSEIDRIETEITEKWNMNPLEWAKYPPRQVGEYLMLYPGQHYTPKQESMGLNIPTSIRQVDTTSELGIPEID